jgi:DNA phosphorothioation-dependent restriction protein DptG
MIFYAKDYMKLNCKLIPEMKKIAKIHAILQDNQQRGVFFNKNIRGPLIENII